MTAGNEDQGGQTWSGGTAYPVVLSKDGTFQAIVGDPVPLPESTQAVGPWLGDHSAYIAGNGVQAAGGWAQDAGSRDPSSDTVAGSIANAVAAMVELQSDTTEQGSAVGDQIPIPPDSYTPGDQPSAMTATAWEQQD